VAVYHGSDGGKGSGLRAWAGASAAIVGVFFGALIGEIATLVWRCTNKLLSQP
jgi:hypothetical protein